MIKKQLLLFGTTLLLLIQSNISFGQDKSDVVLGQFKPDDKQPFIINSSNGPIEISYYILKEGKKTFEFKTDTTSVEYKYLSTINPDWVKSVEVFKNRQMENGITTILVITLKRKTLNKLTPDMRQRFH